MFKINGVEYRLHFEYEGYLLQVCVEGIWQGTGHIFPRYRAGEGRARAFVKKVHAKVADCWQCNMSIWPTQKELKKLLGVDLPVVVVATLFKSWTEEYKTHCAALLEEKPPAWEFYG